MKATEHLYFIAIVPPQPILREAQHWKEYFAEKYHSKAALKSPPHITLHMPFKMKEKKEELLFGVLEEAAQATSLFKVDLKGFGHFGQRVIFINVEDNEPMYSLFKTLMKVMKVNFNIFNADYKNRGFQPHLTLAFRDLKRAAFNQAWPELEAKEYQEQFVAKEFILLKHNGRSWDTYKSFRFNQ